MTVVTTQSICFDCESAVWLLSNFLFRQTNVVQKVDWLPAFLDIMFFALVFTKHCKKRVDEFSSNVKEEDHVVININDHVELTFA